jgi:hypothetical protein
MLEMDTVGHIRQTGAALNLSAGGQNAARADDRYIPRSNALNTEISPAGKERLV